ncbi:MAG TPA: AarF/UbiB family protein [Aggregatilineales bacterium]|nr:AarF/UbiB family protein [Aggregatilineales bacterium]
MQNLKKPPSTSTSSPKPDPIIAFGVPLGPMPEAEAEAPHGDHVVNGEDHAGRHVAPDRAHREYKLKTGRYRRILLFFIFLFSRTILWEMLLRRVLGERFVAPGRTRRYRAEARRFRSLAVDMGGVMIKLGQFVSSRVDVLPPEITDELAGLQDQVPIVPFDYIKTTIEHEIGPIAERFAWLNPEPVAAASFGQVHRGQLPGGERVVVKVQRPSINDIVHTDLTALDAVAQLAMRFSFIRRRANVPALLGEFSRVLWEELDYLAEADHALTFASIFKDDHGIYVPGVYLKYTTALVLTLEDVTAIKINDYKGIEQAGVSRRAVASRLLTCYLHQIFDVRFFHADPHPGNLFVYPLPYDENNNGKAEQAERPFYLVFVDFGMVGRLTPQLQEGLRETLIAVATQNAKALVASYVKLGVLLPDTNLERVEEATRVVFDKVWGLNMTELANLPMEDMTRIAKEFSDLLLSMPFQMPQDFIYLSRAVGILSGMCTGLDPAFDPWREMQPFTQSLLSESSERTQAALGGDSLAATRGRIEIGSKLARDLALRLYKLPALADNVLNRADRGELSVKMTLDENVKRQISRIESSTSQMVFGMVFATLTLAATLLYINHEQSLGLAGYALAGISLLALGLRGRS